MPTALVTGGAGFIGSNLVRGLLERGAQVRVLDDLSGGSRENLAGLDVEVIEADVRDRDALAGGVKGADWVFHLAAVVAVTESMEAPVRTYEVNALGSLRILEAARQAGVERAVLSSSCAVYGDAEGPVAEAAPAAPRSPYAASKAAMEAAAGLYARAYHLPTICLRYFNVYGPRQSPTSDYAAVIPAFIAETLDGKGVTIHGDGHQTRDFVYVDDVVRANLLAAESPRGVRGVFNVGSGESISILDVAEELQRIFPQAPPPVHGPARPGDVRFSQADLTLAREALGYRPKIDFREGLRATVEWFRSNHKDTKATKGDNKDSRRDHSGRRL